MELIRLARTPLKGLEQDFTILAGILSTPVDFLSQHLIKFWLFLNLLLVEMKIFGCLGVIVFQSSEYWDLHCATLVVFPILLSLFILIGACLSNTFIKV